MARSSRLHDEDYKPQFSGHETFPLRYGWLKKAFDAVREDRSIRVFIDEAAVARFGVGKNMVSSMRHWATATGMIQDVISPGRLDTTEIGRKIFGPRGLDPYMEHMATTWLIHWQLCHQPTKTTWHWAFNFYPAATFERDDLVNGLCKLAAERGWRRAAQGTIKNDVACFIRTYVPHLPKSRGSHEDALESPLTELGLIRAVGTKDGFRFSRGRQPTLGPGVFCYAITEFWQSQADVQTLAFETLAHAPGSPGRVFQLDENELVGRLASLEETTGGVYRWSETAGLKQLIRLRLPAPKEIISFLEEDYAIYSRKRVA